MNRLDTKGVTTTDIAVLSGIARTRYEHRDVLESRRDQILEELHGITKQIADEMLLQKFNLPLRLSKNQEASKLAAQILEEYEQDRQPV